MGCNGFPRTLGGRVEPARRREYGFAQLELDPSTELLRGLDSPLARLEQPRRPCGGSAAGLQHYRQDGKRNFGH